MKTPTISDNRVPEPGPGPNGAKSASGGGGRRNRLLAMAVTALLAVGGIAIVWIYALGGETVAGPPLRLSLPESSAMAMCLPLDPVLLAEMSPAFGGTVTSVTTGGTDSIVTIDVDRWYAGGDATTVELRAMTGMEALIDGFDFEVGQRYLITATDGTVNYCGFSGLATPELTEAFQQAFPA